MLSKWRGSVLTAAVWGLGVALSAGAWGQTKGGEGAQAAPATPGRMSINVSVVDKQGHAVSGLTANDFKVLDAAAPQTVVGFKVLHSDGAPGADTHVVLVVDMVNASFSTTAWVRQQLTSFLEQNGGKLAFPTSLAVISENGLRVEGADTRDGKKLVAALNQMQTFLRLLRQGEGYYAVSSLVETSLSQLAQLAAYEQTRPGHKMLLFISPGWPLLPLAGNEELMGERQWVYDSIVELTNGLTEANTTLYCLDPFRLGDTNPFYYQTYLNPVKRVQDAEYPYLALQVLAQHSGGQVLVTSWDIQSALNKAENTATTSYELSFEGTGHGPANAYHPLQVTVDRPDASVYTTAGYYANQRIPPLLNRPPKRKGPQAGAATVGPKAAGGN